jgi:transcriptional regulator with XRE-family HTH domain
VDPLLQVGANIRAARARRGISQEALADLAGLHRTYVGSVERGERNISVLNLCRLAGALESEPAALLASVPALGAKAP